MKMVNFKPQLVIKVKDDVFLSVTQAYTGRDTRIKRKIQFKSPIAR